VLEDLGEDLITIDEWLCPLSGVGPAIEACRSAGARVGSIHAAIHSDAALHERLGLKGFINPDATALWANSLVGKIKKILMEYLPPRHDVESEFQRVEDEAELISGIIRTEYERQDEQNGPQNTMFSNGDLWTGSILISSVDEARIGLIDWEFVGGERVFHDLGQLGAWLYLFA